MKPIHIVLVILVLVTGAVAYWPDRHAQVLPASAAAFFGPEIKGIDAAEAQSRRIAELTVQRYDEGTGAVGSFQVKRGAQGWTIPSHHNYPADGGKRIGEVAGSVLGVEKGVLVSDQASRFEEFEIAAPDDANAAYDRRRGQRVTLKDEQGAVILDVIIGKAVSGVSGLRYVREADSNRVYQAKMSPYISTNFTDWVEQDLLKVQREQIRRLTLDHHSVNEMTGGVDKGPQAIVQRSGSGNDWSSEQAPRGKAVDTAAIDKLLGELASIRIQGVRPSGVDRAPQLRARLMQIYGFFSDGSGQLYGNEGALHIGTADGLNYFTFFGEVAAGDGNALSAGENLDAPAASGPVARPDKGANRHFAIFVRYNPDDDEQLRAIPGLQKTGFLSEKKLGADAKLDEAQQKELDERIAKAIQARRDEQSKKQAELQTRFERFFFVISNDVFEKVRPKVTTLWKDAPAAGSATAASLTAPIPGLEPAVPGN